MFPFTLPGTTVFYLVLYLGTLVLHVAFMSYVLAGGAYLAATNLWRRNDGNDPIATLLRSWLPFMLGMAITAGVAPLLFMQILYRTRFYTANLLMFHRWMAVLPALIAGFYLLYLLKNRWAEQRSPWFARGITFAAAGCFMFVAWSWTENHLLALQTQSVWTQEYRSASLIFRSAAVVPRLAMWFCGTFAVLSVWLSWQLWWPHRGSGTREVAGAPTASVMALGGLLGAGLCGGLYWLAMPEMHRSALLNRAVAPYVLIAGLAVAGQLVVFGQQYRTSESGPKRLTLLSSLSVMMLLAVAVLRESIRVSSVDMDALSREHEAAGRVGGFGVFLVFLILNSLAIGWCLRTVLRSAAGASGEAAAQGDTSP